MCFYCRCKTTRPSVTTHVVTFDDRIIIIKNVPCEECEECGEKYFSDEVMVRLEKIVEAARAIASVKYSKVVGKASKNIVTNNRLANAGFKNLKIGKLGESGVISGIAATYKTIEKILGYLISAGKEVVSLWTR